MIWGVIQYSSAGHQQLTSDNLFCTLILALFDSEMNPIASGNGYQTDSCQLVSVLCLKVCLKFLVLGSKEVYVSYHIQWGRKNASSSDNRAYHSTNEYKNKPSF